MLSVIEITEPMFKLERKWTGPGDRSACVLENYEFVEYRQMYTYCFMLQGAVIFMVLKLDQK